MSNFTRSDAQKVTTSSAVSTRHVWRVLLLSLFVIGFAVRLLHANEPPLHFHPTRQYRSLLIARDYYLQRAPSATEWQRNVARISRERQGLLEPPIMEHIVAVGYHVAGGERFWVPRVVGAFFWLLGGVFLYLIAMRLVGAMAGLLSAAFHLFVPFAIVASTSFQPEPLMVALLLFAVHAIIRYFDAPSMLHLLCAALISALAFLVKPVSVFPILGVYMALALGTQGIRKTVRRPQSYLFLLVSLTPVALFYGYGLIVADVLLTQAVASFLPQFLLSPLFWRGWLGNVEAAVGLAAFFIGMIGLWLFPDTFSRLVGIGLWSGYVVFCLVFSYHIATHDYYHLVLVPIVGLSIGPLGALVLQRIWSAQPTWYARAGLPAIALLALLLAAGKAEKMLWTPQAEQKIRVAFEIGEHVNHSTSTVYLSADYGLPLEYHGRLSGTPWPLTSDLEWERLAGMRVLGAEERFDLWFRKEPSEYFIVRDLQEFERQNDLQQFLAREFPVVAQNEGYMIFDLR